MGMLFENMQKMDIQEERRKTAEQRARAEEAEQKAEEAERKLESILQILINDYHKVGMMQDEIVEKVKEIYQLDANEAREKVEKYWKEN